MKAEFNLLLTFLHFGANDLGAYSCWYGSGVVQVSENLDVGNTSRRKIHPRRPTGRISPALRAGGSSSSPSALPSFRMRTPCPCSCQMMFARADVMAWMGYNMGEGGGYWLGRVHIVFVN